MKISNILKKGISIIALYSMFSCSNPVKDELNKINQEIISESPKRELIIKESEKILNENRKVFLEEYFNECETNLNPEIKNQYLKELGYFKDNNFKVMRVSLDKKIIDAVDQDGRYLEIKIISENPLKIQKSCDFSNDSLLKKIIMEIDPKQTIIDYLIAEESKDIEKEISFYYGNSIMWNGKRKTVGELKNMHTKYLNSIYDYFIIIDNINSYVIENNAFVNCNIRGGYTKNRKDTTFKIEKNYKLKKSNNEWKITSEENIKSSSSSK